MFGINKIQNMAYKGWGELSSYDTKKGDRLVAFFAFTALLLYLC